MQHAMRRKDRAMDENHARQLLENGEYGVMGTVDENGQPYAVPLSYIVEGDVIYFHCAHEGRKITNISQNPKVSFTVVGKTMPVYDNNFTTYYESVIVFGTVIKVDNPDNKTRLLMLLAQKYLPRHMDKAAADIAKSLERTAVYAIGMEQVSGKAKKPRP